MRALLLQHNSSIHYAIFNRCTSFFHSESFLKKEMFCEDEKENLFEQLTQQDRALETLQKDIAEYKRVKKEYLESIIQMQSKGRFLTKKQEQRPELIQIEIGKKYGF